MCALVGGRLNPRFVRELAELLDYPILTGVRQMDLDGASVRAKLEHDDGWADAAVSPSPAASARAAAIDI